MKTIEERILEAEADFCEAKFYLPVGHSNLTIAEACQRIVRRCEKRLADLEAIRDGKAAEVYATVCVNEKTEWASYGRFNLDPRDDDVLIGIHDGGDRLTILRGIAYMPVATPDEAEAESEEA